MQNFLMVGLFLLLTLPGSAQESEVRQVSSFTGVHVREGIDVYLKKGNSQEIRVEASGTSVSNVVTEVTGSSLRIHMKEGGYRNRTIRVYVNYDNLDRITSNTGSSVFVEGTVTSSEIELTASSAGSIEISIDADKVAVDVSGAGEVTLGGKAKEISVDASTAGDVDAYGLEVEVVNAQASTGGSAKVNVTRELSAQASTGGDIRYHGNPMKVNTHSATGGSVKKSN